MMRTEKTDKAIFSVTQCHEYNYKNVGQWSILQQASQFLRKLGRLSSSNNKFKNTTQLWSETKIMSFILLKKYTRMNT